MQHQKFIVFFYFLLKSHFKLKKGDFIMNKCFLMIFSGISLSILALTAVAQPINANSFGKTYWSVYNSTGAPVYIQEDKSYVVGTWSKSLPTQLRNFGMLVSTLNSSHFAPGFEDGQTTLQFCADKQCVQPICALTTKLNNEYAPQYYATVLSPYNSKQYNCSVIKTINVDGMTTAFTIAKRG